MKEKPLAIDLYCGLGGWAEGFISEGYSVIGFDIEYRGSYPSQIVLQDVTTLHGRQFRNATVIVASPPCQGYSYRAMPWKKAKALPPPDNTLFEACFRIQREASEAAGRYIPMVVENVRGAQKWIGKAKWHYGSYYLWGDVPALMPIVNRSRMKSNPNTHDRIDGPGRPRFIQEGVKSHGMNWSNRELRGQDFTRLAGAIKAAEKSAFGWAKALPFRENTGRKEWAALIAKIPFPLAQWIARVFKNDLETGKEN